MILALKHGKHNPHSAQVLTVAEICVKYFLEMDHGFKKFGYILILSGGLMKLSQIAYFPF